MADFYDHLQQAEHNHRFARHLDHDGDLAYWDWLITISFYAAVHYVEALFCTIDSIRHTEKVCPDDTSPHSFRQKAVLEHLGTQCWKSYRELQNASYNVRYLALGYTRGRAGTAVTYFSRQDASDFLTQDLEQVKRCVQAQVAE